MVDSEKWIKHGDKLSLEYPEYRKFWNSINEDSTKKTYAYDMVRFMKFASLKKFIKTDTSFSQLTKYQPVKITDILQEWVYELNLRLKKSAIQVMISSPELFFDMNAKLWHKKIVRRSIKNDKKKKGGKDAATNNDVIGLLDATNLLVEKALIHFLASTGIRPGGIADPVLVYGGLVKMPDDCYAITVYDESEEGYWAFLTPEASNILNQYFNMRKSNGEDFDEFTPLFLNVIGTAMAPSSTRKIMYKLIKKSGMKRIKSGNRYNKAVITMFRKRFNGKLKMENDVNSNIAEKLMAHKRGLDGTYLQPTREECFKEFVKAIPELTIDPTERQRLEIEKQKLETTENQKIINELKEKTVGKILDMEQQIKELQEKNQLEIEEKNSLAVNYRNEKASPLTDDDLKEFDLTIPKLEQIINDELIKNTKNKHKEIFDNSN